MIETVIKLLQSQCFTESLLQRAETESLEDLICNTKSLHDLGTLLREIGPTGHMLMKFLIDHGSEKVLAMLAEYPDFVSGQLLTPLTRYADACGVYAIDNGAFSGFRQSEFCALLKRQSEHKDRCLFVTCPDIVGSARRTLELFLRRSRWIDSWPVALVAQNGLEDMDVPWDDLQCLFIGGRDPWKESQACADLVRTAKTLGKHGHIGRVNTAKRYRHFADLGADTCDGSGVARYDHMLRDIVRAMSRSEPDLFPDTAQIAG